MVIAIMLLGGYFLDMWYPMNAYYCIILVILSYLCRECYHEWLQL